MMLESLETRLLIYLEAQSWRTGLSARDKVAIP